MMKTFPLFGWIIGVGLFPVGVDPWKHNADGQVCLVRPDSVFNRYTVSRGT
jgi:hypothetical protein